MIVHGYECHGCGYFVFSRAQHDYRTCRCGAVAVDGGHGEFMRVVRSEKTKAKGTWAIRRVSASVNDLWQDWDKAIDRYGHIKIRRRKNVTNRRPASKR